MISFENIKDFFVDSYSQNSTSSDEIQLHYFDNYGRDIFISLSEWLKKILPEELKRTKNKPFALHKLILFCLENGISEYILESAKQLHSKEPTNEEYCITLANVYIQCNLLDDAELLLTTFIKNISKTGALLTTLGKVYNKLSKHDLVLKTLWEGLLLDPNQVRALYSYLLLVEKAENNDECIINKLNILSEQKNSWLPQLFLANISLQNKDLECALMHYIKIIKTSNKNQIALSIIAKDLSYFKYDLELISLIEPLYNFDTMSHIIGLKLLQAYANQKIYKKGEALLHKFMTLDNPCYSNFLLNISSILDIYKPMSFVSSEKPSFEYTITVFDTPIWYYSLGNPEWLLNQNPKLNTIGLLPFIDFTQKSHSINNIYYEDDTSRLSRSIPLYIGEKIHYETNYDFNYLLPIAIPYGPIIRKNMYSEKYLSDISQKNNTPIVIFGSIEKSKNKYLFNISVYNQLTKESNIYPFSASQNNFGKNINSMLDYVFSHITNLTTSSSNIYTQPENDKLYTYLQLLSNSLTQTLIVNKLLTPNSILGERNMINSYFINALNNTDNHINKIILLSGLSKNKNYNSNIYLESKNKMLKFFSENEKILDKSLLPFIFKLYDIYPKEEQVDISQYDNSLYSTWINNL